MIKNKKIYVAGHTGMVGSSICRLLRQTANVDLITINRSHLDLTNQSDVYDFFEREKPDEVYLCSAKVGGILANNSFPAEFIYENLMIESNIIHSAWKFNIKKLMFLGSSCIYPKLAKQPIKEDYLLNGYLERTNEPYAIAKIAGIKLCESYNRQYGVDFRSAMPTNLYGINDNYDLNNSHVIPALIRRFYEAKISNLSEVTIWGTGDVKREFLYTDDLAKGLVHIMSIDKEPYWSNLDMMNSHINIGYGSDMSIKSLAALIAKTVNYSGEILFDTSKPDGPPRKLMDSSKISNLGWKPLVNLEEGLKKTYESYKNTLNIK